MVHTSTKDHANPAPTIALSRRAQRYEEHRRHVRRRIIVVISAVLLAATVTVIVVISSGGGATETTTPFAGSTLNVVLGDYLIAGDLTAPAGPVRLEAVNNGGLEHNVGIRRGPISGTMQPGGAFTTDLGYLAPGTYQLYCDIVGHVEQGMVADLVIT